MFAGRIWEVVTDSTRLITRIVQNPLEKGMIISKITTATMPMTISTNSPNRFIGRSTKMTWAMMMAQVPAKKMMPDRLVVIPRSSMWRGNGVSRNPMGKAMAKAITRAGPTAMFRYPNSQEKDVPTTPTIVLPSELAVGGLLWSGFPSGISTAPEPAGRCPSW